MSSENDKGIDIMIAQLFNHFKRSYQDCNWEEARKTLKMLDKLIPTDNDLNKLAEKLQ